MFVSHDDTSGIVVQPSHKKNYSDPLGGLQNASGSLRYGSCYLTFGAANGDQEASFDMPRKEVARLAEALVHWLAVGELP